MTSHPSRKKRVKVNAVYVRDMHLFRGDSLVFTVQDVINDVDHY
jgi:hypothetical protein